MPSYSRGNQPPLEYYLRILLALVRKSGGELRIKCSDIDRVSEKTMLDTDYDAEANELVLRARSQFGETVIIQPEAHAWVRPPSERAEALNQTPARTSVPSDKDLAEIEAGLLRRAAARRQTTRANETHQNQS